MGLGNILNRIKSLNKQVAFIHDQNIDLAKACEKLRGDKNKLLRAVKWYLECLDCKDTLNPRYEILEAAEEELRKLVEEI